MDTCNECCICLELYKTPTKFWKCTHATCRTCGIYVISCPLCRASVKPVREDWLVVATEKGMWFPNVPDDIKLSQLENCVVKSWNEHGRCTVFKHIAKKEGIVDVRRSW